MPEKPSAKVTKIAIRVAAAGLGAAVAGPLGCALGAAFGDALSGPLGEMVHNLAEEGMKKSAEKLFDAGGDLVAERIKGADGNLEAAYREALRLSLATLHPQMGRDYQDWFEHWELCLKVKEILRLDDVGADQLALTKIDSVLHRTMVRLDAQGAMLRRNQPSRTLVERKMPKELDAALTLYLPELFDDSFKTLIVSDEYEVAWRQVQLRFQEYVSSSVISIKADTTAIRADTSVLVSGVTLTNEKLDQLLVMAIQRAEEGERIGRAEARALKAEGESEEWKRKYLDAAKDDPPLEALLETGDLDEAALKTEEQLKRHDQEKVKTYIKLGRIHELRFDWAKALDAYQRAWKLEPSWDNGFRYAYLAQKQNRHKDAITAYEGARSLSDDTYSAATTLNNLANLYSATQRMRDAELAYGEALSIRRQLAKQNPEAYLPDVAMTLNNLAILYSDTQRMRDAELAYGEALATYRQLAEQNPEAYLPDVATTLNNLAILYSDTQRMRDAEQAFSEALATYRQLAEQNPEAYLPYVATMLNNLAILYSDTQREDEGLRLCREAVSILRPLWNDNPAVHGNQMARILWAIADLLGANSELDACKLAREALGMAYDPGVKAGIERSIARWCGDGEADSRRE